MKKSIAKFLVVAMFAVFLMPVISACSKTEKFTVTFNANGGTGAPAAITGVESGSKVSAPTAADIARTGYTFANKWYKEAACTTEWKFASDTVTGNITLYAGWTKVAEEETYDPDELTKGFFGAPVDGVHYVFIRLYENGIFYADFLSDRLAGFYEVVENVTAKKNNEPTSFEIGLKFTDFKGNDILIAGYDPAADTIWGTTTAGWNMGFAYYGLEISPSYEDQISISMYDYRLLTPGEGQENRLLALSYDGTFTDTTSGTMYSGTWVRNGFVYILFGTDLDDKEVIYTVVQSTANLNRAFVTYPGETDFTNLYIPQEEVIKFVFEGSTEDLSVEMLLIVNKYEELTGSLSYGENEIAVTAWKEKEDGSLEVTFEESEALTSSSLTITKEDTVYSATINIDGTDITISFELAEIIRLSGFTDEYTVDVEGSPMTLRNDIAVKLMTDRSALITVERMAYQVFPAFSMFVPTGQITNLTGSWVKTTGGYTVAVPAQGSYSAHNIIISYSLGSYTATLDYNDYGGETNFEIKYSAEALLTGKESFTHPVAGPLDAFVHLEIWENGKANVIFEIAGIGLYVKEEGIWIDNEDDTYTVTIPTYSIEFFGQTFNISEANIIVTITDGVYTATFDATGYPLVSGNNIALTSVVE